MSGRKLVLGLLALALVPGACGGRDESTGGPSEAGATGSGDAGQHARGGSPDVPIGRSDGGSDTADGGVSAGAVAGTTGDSGSGGSAPIPVAGAFNTGGNPPVQPGTGTVGSPCTALADCREGLTCLTETSTALAGGAPPRGLCTAPCDATSVVDQCGPLSPGSLCYPFSSLGTAGYCVEGCAFGEPPIGQAKCHNRLDFACNPALLGDTTDPCLTTEGDCVTGDLCVDGTCQVVFTACLPSCRGDVDCPAGLFCDQSFLSGTCVATPPTGKALGEPCTVPSDAEPAEPDECLGFCQADSRSSTAGHCATSCGIGSECAWNATTEVYDGACFYASILTVDIGSFGDFGFCTPACNCSDECNSQDLACLLLDVGGLPEQSFRGAGLCFAPDATAVEYDACQ